MDTYLVAKRKLLRIADASLKKCTSEESVLETLLKTKPKALGCNNPLRAEFSEIDEEVKFYEEQFRRKGLTERSERFQYLIATLKSKLRDEPETFYSVIGFLLELENNPTNSLEPLDVRKKHYSSEPDLIEVVSNENELRWKRNAAEFREEMVRELKECQLSKDDTPPLDSDLSEWSSDEENDDFGRAPGHEKFPATIQLTETAATEELSKINKKLLKKSSDNQKWKSMFTDASGVVKENISKVTFKPLTAQPMIASYEDLTLKFGEFWEWHKLGSIRSGKHIVMQVVTEESIVREIMWHFSNPSSSLSPIFTDDWTLKPNIMTSTLNHATLETSLANVGTVMRMMQRMRAFLRNFQASSSEVGNYQSSRVVEALAYAVSQILESVSSNVSKVYDDYLHGQKFLTKGEVKTSGSVSTILQMIRHCLKLPLAIVKALDAVFIQSFGSSYEEVELGNSQAWFNSIRVLSSTEMSLKTEGRPQVWRILFYMYSQCLRAYFFEFFSPLDTSAWAPGCPFYRNESIGLHDAQFWTDCIGVQPYANDLKELGVSPTSFVRCLQTETLAIIKILEMLRLLGEDCKVILQSRVDPDALLHEFLIRVLPQQFKLQINITGEVASAELSKTSKTQQIRPFVEYLHLSDNKVFDTFRNTLKVDKNKTHSRNYSDSKRLSAFQTITCIPTEDFSEILVAVIQNLLGPAFTRAKDSLKRIFQEHKVLESLALFQEIILGAREDFSQAVFQLAKKSKASSKFAYEPEDNRNPSFQKLLNECYPEGRENFEINFIMDSTHDLNFKFLVKPLFPLNLILSPESIKKYMFVSHQLLRIRKSLWGLNSLKLKDCKVLQGVNLQRAFLFRFSLIHFCSSLRAFLMFKILASNNLSAVPHLAREITDLDQIVKAHEKYLRTIDSRLMRIKFIHAIVIQKITSMSDYLQKTWVKGIDLNYMIKLEECLKQCWSIVSDFCLSPISAEFTELFYYVGSPPSYL